MRTPPATPRSSPLIDGAPARLLPPSLALEPPLPAPPLVAAVDTEPDAEDDADMEGAEEEEEDDDDDEADDDEADDDNAAAAPTPTPAIAPLGVRTSAPANEVREPATLPPAELLSPAAE